MDLSLAAHHAMHVSTFLLTKIVILYIYTYTIRLLSSIYRFTMSVKRAAREQYQAIVDVASGSRIDIPAEGWIRTVRKALGMSGAQLAKRMGVTRARIAQAEKSELDGGVTLKSMEATAEAMGCRFVYAFVPPDTIETIILAQARKKAQAIVERAGKHMALEDQALSDSRTQREFTRLVNELVYEMPADFWQDG